MNTINSNNKQSKTETSSSRERKPMFKFNKIFSVTTMALFGLLLLISCDEISSSADKIKPEEIEIKTEQIQNAKNPYDEEGQIHNKFLDYFVEATAKDTAVDQKRALVLIENFYAQNEMELGREQIQGFNQLFEAYSELGLGLPGPIFPTPTDILCRWFPTVCDILNPSGPFLPYALNNDDLGEENGGTSTERTLKFIETTKAQEAMVLESKELDDEHRNALLAQYAIARYSAAYWHNVENIQQQKSGYYTSLIESDNAIASKCHTCDVVGADAAGAAVGSVVPGVGTGVGAGVASAAAAIEKLFTLW
ncbi:MAG: hypothetical protein WC967_07645 [Balneolaceae bacterium]